LTSISRHRLFDGSRLAYTIEGGSGEPPYLIRAFAARHAK